tara:strand:- start:208 stop:342 length:135 start_codon:yes stop_codon:yes gene_type:complete
VKNKKIKIVVGVLLVTTVAIISICFYIIQAVNEVANALDGSLLD